MDRKIQNAQIKAEKNLIQRKIKSNLISLVDTKKQSDYDAEIQKMDVQEI